jgi:hypothetical protein
VYPVTLSIVNWASTPRFPAGLRRTTAAMVTVGNKPVVSWTAGGRNRGDGAYPVWIGRDPGATIVAILIDLELLSHASSRLEGTPL